MRVKTTQSPTLSRRLFLKSSAAIATVASVQARADLLIGRQISSQQPINESDSNNTNEPTTKQAIPVTPVYDFANIQTQTQAMRGYGVPLHLIAPAGFSSDEQHNLLAIHRLTQAGFYIDNPEVISRRFLRFAGSDSERLGDLRDLLHKPIHEIPKIIMGVRGGYGAMRLLNCLTSHEWQTLTHKLKARGTLFMGFSDITALQLALLAKGSMPYIAGSMLSSDFGKINVNQNTIQSFINICTQTQLIIPVTQTQNYGIKNRITGKIWGGNLSVLSALVGTPYMPSIKGGILFLEDTGEQPYRIERMLQTLILSGILAKQQAVVLGKFNFTGISDAYNGDYTFDTVINYLHKATRLPIYTDFPFGHVAERINFPLGVTVTLEADNSGYHAIFNQFYNLRDEANFANLDLTKLFI